MPRDRTSGLVVFESLSRRSVFMMGSFQYCNLWPIQADITNTTVLYLVRSIYVVPCSDALL